MSERTVISSPDAPPAIGPYSQGINTGSFVFLSGQIPLVRDTGKFVRRRASRSRPSRSSPTSRRCSPPRASTLADVVKATVFLADMNEFAAMNEVYAKHFTGTPPGPLDRAGGAPAARCARRNRSHRAGEDLSHARQHASRQAHLRHRPHHRRLHPALRREEHTSTSTSISSRPIPICSSTSPSPWSSSVPSGHRRAGRPRNGRHSHRHDALAIDRPARPFRPQKSRRITAPARSPRAARCADASCSSSRTWSLPAARFSMRRKPCAKRARNSAQVDLRHRPRIGRPGQSRQSGTYPQAPFHHDPVEAGGRLVYWLGAGVAAAGAAAGVAAAAGGAAFPPPPKPRPPPNPPPPKLGIACACC